MNRTEKFIYNTLSMAVLQVVTMLAAFITPRLMLDAYGSEVNGLVSSITQFIAYFNLVEAGLSGAAIYALYKPLADNDYKDINAVVSAAKKFYTQSGYIFISLTIGLALIYPLYIKMDILSPLSIGLLVLILGTNGALEFFTLSKYRVLLTADQKTYVVSIASIVHIIINTVIIVILTHYKVNVVILRLVALLSIFLRSIILSIYCKKRYKYLNYKEKPNIQALDKRWDALFLQVLGVVQKGAPIVIITVILGDLKLISVYTIFYMIAGGIDGILSIFISGLSASFGDIIVRGENKSLQRVYGEFEFIYYSLITIVYSVAFMTIMPFIKIYTAGINDINYDVPIIGFLFILNGLLYNVKTPQGMLVISAGMYRETRWQAATQALIMIIGGIVSTRAMGISGVLMASIFSNLYRDIDLIFFIPKHLTKLPVKQTLFRIARMFIVVSVVITTVSYFKVDLKNFLTWTAYASGVGVYTVVLVLVTESVFERSQVVNIVQRIKSCVRIKKTPNI